MDDAQIWFRSSLFVIDPDEDSAGNPHRYGKALAAWLRSKLIEQGRAAEEAIEEDWGWCLPCAEQPFALWIGCGHAFDPRRLPATSEDIIWTCFAAAEAGWLKRWCNGISRQDMDAAAAELFAQVQRIIAAEPAHRLVESP